MPCPENQYYLQTSQELNLIPADAVAYLMHVEPYADRFIDGLARRPARITGFHRYWHDLQAGGEACEQHFLNWRSEHPVETLALSLTGYESLAFHVQHFIEAHAHLLVDHGFDRPTRLGLQLCDQRYGYRTQAAMLRRLARRCHSDLDGYSEAGIAAARERRVALMDAPRERRDRALDELAQIVAQTQQEWRERGLYDELPLTRANRQLEAARRSQRRSVVRSLLHSERLLGPEPVRLFVGGEAIRVEGRLANYEITRKRYGNLSSGDANLAVFAKGGIAGQELELCRLCIHTRGVPMMDHVVSLILHIQADDEETILRIGNAYSVREEAYDQDWLVPFLPKRLHRTGTRGGNPSLTGMPRIPPVARGPREIELPRRERTERIRAMSRLLLDELLDRNGHVLPPLDDTIRYLCDGRMSPERQDATVTIDVPLNEEMTIVEEAEARAEAITALHFLAEPEVMRMAREEGLIR